MAGLKERKKKLEIELREVTNKENKCEADLEKVNADIRRDDKKRISALKDSMDSPYSLGSPNGIRNPVHAALEPEPEPEPEPTAGAGAEDDVY